jgi:uncharacterized protein
MKNLIKSFLRNIKKHKKTFWIRFILFIIFIGLLIFISRLNFRVNKEVQAEKAEEVFPTKSDLKKSIPLTLGQKIIRVVVADETNERTIGLSQYTGLSENEGMLFVFEESDFYSFWMRHMQFPIDIIWLDENKNIVFIKENALPEEYPMSYKPTAKALYVLEVQSGFVKNNMLAIGQTLSW